MAKKSIALEHLEIVLKEPFPGSQDQKASSKAYWYAIDIFEKLSNSTGDNQNIALGIVRAIRVHLEDGPDYLYSTRFKQVLGELMGHKPL